MCVLARSGCINLWGAWVMKMHNAARSRFQPRARGGSRPLVHLCRRGLRGQGVRSLVGTAAGGVRGLPAGTAVDIPSQGFLFVVACMWKSG